MHAHTTHNTCTHDTTFMPTQHACTHNTHAHNMHAHKHACTQHACTHSNMHRACMHTQDVCTHNTHAHTTRMHTQQYAYSMHAHTICMHTQHTCTQTMHAHTTCIHNTRAHAQRACPHNTHAHTTHIHTTTCMHTQQHAHNMHAHTTRGALDKISPVPRVTRVNVYLVVHLHTRTEPWAVTWRRDSRPETGEELVRGFEHSDHLASGPAELTEALRTQLAAGTEAQVVTIGRQVIGSMKYQKSTYLMWNRRVDAHNTRKPT